MNLWPVEPFCPPFFPDQCSADLEKKSGQKGSTGQRFICMEVCNFLQNPYFSNKVTLTK